MYLVNSSPVPFVLQQHPLPQHSHHFGKVFICKCVLWYFLHEDTSRSPSIIVCSLTDFGLHFGVTHYNIGSTSHLYIFETDCHCNQRNSQLRLSVQQAYDQLLHRYNYCENHNSEKWTVTGCTYNKWIKQWWSADTMNTSTFQTK